MKDALGRLQDVVIEVVKGEKLCDSDYKDEFVRMFEATEDA